MTALLTDNLPLLAGSPNGIKKLRELILELAVSGKLVPQDPNDEPASGLLKRIAEDKADLVRKGKIKKQKPLAEIGNQEAPFELPKGWEWVRLGELSQIKGGKRLPAGATFSSAPTPHVYIQVTNMKGGTVIEQNLKYIDEATQAAIRQYTISKNDLYITIAGTIGDVGSVPERFDGMNLTENAAKIVFLGADKHWLQKTLCSYFVQRQFSENTNKLAQPKLALHRIAESLLALPPISEQQRIVAKVDELMALCDRLEAQQEDAESAHAQLVQALLNSLTQASDATEFATSWQRLAGHFHTLFTTESSIDALKQTLLQLAFMGKLVPPNISNEPACALPKQIAEKNARLVVEEGKLQKQKPLAEIAEAEKTFVLPVGWRWVRLEEIAQIGTGATPLRTNPKYFEAATINWVTSGETSQDFIRQTEQKVAPIALTETNLTVYPPHTLIVAMYGQGKTRGQISELLIEACTNQACAAIQLFDQDESHRRYVKYFFVKSYDDIRLLAAGGAQPNLNLGKIKGTVLPLPPAIEQHRIVAKVDQLITLCEQLKSRLAQVRQVNEQLASTLVEQAVA